MADRPAVYVRAYREPNDPWDPRDPAYSFLTSDLAAVSPRSWVLVVYADEEGGCALHHDGEVMRRGNAPFSPDDADSELGA